ncbi:hypothetical protein AMIS_46180 [Actinoplanes missouriensis 431]|uniref:Uncharacterized protein n=1 Tax=Actinoplanes missouriensis (strain ATCC 14538 / DSM 43046 / CBS 188.64 / JCM 3121 / NBRC 102363 / NCIMB 12654 / NRRL B-3342 / UNCC 431) TaxID=512565 RepID=I0HA01_ACTM4|nr:hypothetical protein [Actinoplanes missouriensis]BAL89838.1 hypothetical protein AMIS_46180 [Actinoplanes missouriensis 431]
MGDGDVDRDALLRRAAELRQAAAAAGRDDVVTKVDEVVLLIAGDRVAQQQNESKANTVLRILNGLGF